MSAARVDDPAHAHSRGALKKTLGNEVVGLCDAAERARHGEDAIMDARDDLADAGADTSLVAEAGDILTGLADDDTGFFGGDNGAQGQLRLGVFFFGPGSRLAVRVSGKPVKGVRDVVDIGGGGSRDFFGRHDVVGGWLVGRVQRVVRETNGEFERE